MASDTPKPTIAEVVARLDAIADPGFSGALSEDPRRIRFEQAVISAYPTLRAAALRAERLEGALQGLCAAAESHLSYQFVGAVSEDLATAVRLACSALGRSDAKEER